MLTVLAGLGAALTYGSADFLGGLAARRLRPAAVTAIAAGSGLLALLLALLVVPSSVDPRSLALGAAAGLATAVAITLLYACLAIGPMSILSPLTAVVSAIVPVAVALGRGETPSAVGAVGLGVILVAVVLVGFVPEEGAVRPTLRTLAMAVTSGAFLGAFYLLLGLTPPESGLVPLVSARATTGIVLGLAVAVTALIARRRVTARTGSLRLALVLAIGCGVIDAASNVLLLIGLRMGDLTVVSVLISLYPAGTIVLAALVLRERIARWQIAGLVLALVGAGALAAG